MAVKPVDFLTVAERSLNILSGEIAARTAVSRAYYSMYHTALSLLHEPPPRYPSSIVKGGVHAALSYYLCSEACDIEGYDKNDLAEIGVKLRMMKSRRVTADYYLEREISAKTAKDTIHQANEMAHIVEKLKTEYVKE